MPPPGEPPLQQPPAPPCAVTKHGAVARMHTGHRTASWCFLYSFCRSRSVATAAYRASASSKPRTAFQETPSSTADSLSSAWVCTNIQDAMLAHGD